MLIVRAVGVRAVSVGLVIEPEDEHLHGLGSTRLRLESLRSVEAGGHAIEKIPVGLPLEDLHHHVPSRLEPGRAAIEEFVAQSNGSMMVAEVIAGGVWRHVRKHHVEPLDTDRRGIEVSQIALDQIDLVDEVAPLDVLEIDADHPAPGADSTSGHLAPRAGRGPRIQNDITSFENLPTLIYLEKLERGARPIALSFGLTKPMVLDLTHGLDPNVSMQAP